MSAKPDTDDPAFLTVRELADLLRIKERKVYDLAASGTVPCSRATGKLLFPTAEIHDWIAAASSGGGATRLAPRQPIFLGSHDPLLDWALGQSRCGLATYLDGSLDGLDRFQNREGIATGLHLHDSDSDDWNISAVSERFAGANAVLIAWAARSRGLLVRRGVASVSGLRDLAGRRLVPRQSESGTDRLFAHLLSASDVPAGEIALAPVARSEQGAAQSVAEGQADATFGLEALAHPYGLDFVPVIEERFDILVDRKAWFDPPMRKLMDFCAGDAFAARAATLRGYTLPQLGKVRWNA